MKINPFSVARASKFLTSLSQKSIAFAIALAVFLLPIQIPFYDLMQEVEVAVSANDNALEHYEKQSVKTPETKVVYTKGETTPRIEAPLTVLTPDLSATAGIPDVVEEVEEETSSHRSYNFSNTIAAEQVASGNSSSELTQVTLDEGANIVAVVDTHGSKTTAEYDENGNPLKIVNPDGTTTYYSYDEDGNLTNIYKQKEDTTVASKNIFQSIARAVFKPLTATANGDEEIDLAYEDGNMTSVGNGTNDSAFEYDEEGLLTREIRSDGSSVEYAYDELGNVVEKIEVDAEDDDDEVAFGVNPFLSIASAFSGFFSRSLASVLPASYSEVSEYNDDNRLARFAIQKDIAVVEDVATTTESIPVTEVVPTATSTVVETAPSTSTTSVEVVPEATPEVVVPPVETVTPAEILPVIIETITEPISYFRNLFSFAYAEDIATTTESTVATTSVVVEVAPVSAPALLDLAFTYDAQGNITEMKSTSGIATSYIYDQTTNALISKSVRASSSLLTTLSYVTDSSARVVSSQNTSGQTSYAYTSDGMLARAGGAEYSFDERGNRVSKTGTDGAVSYTYDGNRLTQTTYASGRTTSYTYNENGAVIALNDSEKGTTAFAYTSGGAVESITTASEKITYAYDALGRRVSRDSSVTGLLEYSYTGSQLKKVYGADGTVLREYFYTPKGEIVAVVMGDTLFHIVYDRNHSIIALINDTTGETLTQNYDVWGAVQNSTFTSSFDLGYLGAYSETSLNLSILGPRVYDPAIGRFLSKDPLPGVIIDSLSQNEYIYAKNDPVNQYDPSGHASELADASESPKRALVETNSAIAGIETELADAKNELARAETASTQTPEDITLATTLSDATIRVASLEEALAGLYEIRDAQKAEIYENEHPVVEVVEVVPVVETVVPVTVPENATTTDAVGTSTEVSADTASSTSTSVENQSPEITQVIEEAPAPSATEVQAEVIAPVEETPAEVAPEAPVSYLSGMLLAVGTFIGEHIQKAEAKSKSKSKSKNKSKNKKKSDAKKAKKKASDKAKKAQQKKAKLIQKIGKALKKLTKELEKSRKNDAKSQQTSSSISNVSAGTSAGAKALATSAQAPSTKSSTITTYSASSAGMAVVQPQMTLTVPKSLQTIDGAHMALTACGFEQTIVGAACGVADGVLYLFQGQWGSAGLSVFSAVPFVGGLADAGKSAKLALKVAEDARLAALAKTVVFKSPSFSSLKVVDSNLKNLVNDLYKGYGSPRQLGSGSTADAIRNEIKTKIPTEGIFHSQKGQELINALNNWLRKYPNATAGDKTIANQLIADLTDALK